jgi:signal transduction histidine kinase/CheY-like chemotaxis protein
MAQKAALEDLLAYIRILILDDDPDVGKSTMIRLQQNGYPNVEFTQSIQKAWDSLEQTNILLIDHYLNEGSMNGIEFTRAAKEKLGADLDIIIYSGSVEKLAENALQAGATACLEKPLKFEYLQLWIKETAKRIWLEKVLNTIPDEVIVIDPREEQFGLIHYANKAKKDRFEEGSPLEYDYCWKRFERQDEGQSPCPKCLSRDAKDEGRILRTYWEYTNWQGKRESVDLHAVPIRDQVGEIRGVIETCRDRTDREIVNRNFQKIEAASNWETRLNLFIEGFKDLGYTRVRFYQKLVRNGTEVFQGVKQIGMPGDFDIKNFSYDASTDMAIEITSQEKHPTLFLVKPNLGYNWEPAKPYTHVYRVDDRLVLNNEELKKSRWIEIPVIANGEIIAKVSVEPLDPLQFISNYNLEVLAQYAAWGGQALDNAEKKEKLRLNSETNQLIIQINQQISKRPIYKGWVYRSLERVCRVLDTASCSVFLLDGRDRNARLVRRSCFVRDVNGNQVEKTLMPESYKKGHLLTGNVFKTGENIIINNLIELAEEQNNVSVKRLNLRAYNDFVQRIGEPVRNAMFVVLRSEGRKIGVIRVLHKRRADAFGSHDFTTDDLAAFEALAGQISLAYETSTMVKELKESQKLKEFIAQEYSHTLKNLLQPVVTISGLLQRDPTDQELWDLLSGEIMLMKTTINTMLHLVQEEPSSLTINKSQTNIMQMLNKVVKPYTILAADKNMSIKLVAPPDMPSILVDETLIHDAIANLLDNAVKYGDANTLIKVTARIDKEHLIIAVSDIGIMITKQERKKVFEKNYSKKAYADTVSHIGLGLTYVKTVTEAHKGIVYVDTRFRNGAKIVMKLPIHPKVEERI